MIVRFALAPVALASVMWMPGGGGEGAQANTSVPPTTLGQLRDVARPVLVLAPSASDLRAQEQVRILDAHRADAHDRQMVTVVLPADHTTSGTTSLTLTQADSRAARERFGVAPSEFVVILLGKDGGEKLRDHAPVSFARLQALVDSMPMRQAEVGVRRVTR